MSKKKKSSSKLFRAYKSQQGKYTQRDLTKLSDKIYKVTQNFASFKTKKEYEGGSMVIRDRDTNGKKFMVEMALMGSGSLLELYYHIGGSRREGGIQKDLIIANQEELNEAIQEFTTDLSSSDSYLLLDRKNNPSKGKSVLGALILGGIIGHSMKK